MLEEFASILFLKVDSEWEAHRAEDTLYYYYLKEDALGKMRTAQHLLRNLEILTLLVSVCAIILVLAICFRYYKKRLC